MGDVPGVAVRPPIRCCFRLVGSPLVFCGKGATFQRFTTGAPLPDFYCAEHSRAGDEEIPDDAIFRLVTVTLEIRMCGTSQTPGIAMAEAIGQLERAVEKAGGVINLHAGRSILARQEPRPGVGPQPPGRPRAN